ncbi:MAG: hypothetical protein JWQ25_156, partial [Daejeonella sp.]|nr:hypothetical protein [Daejeonella sp.]
MYLYQQYINGETEKVYEKISSLGQDAFSSSIFPDIEKVLTETFKRVAFNLGIIHKELTNIDYKFRTEADY